MLAVACTVLVVLLLGGRAHPRVVREGPSSPLPRRSPVLILVVGTVAALLVVVGILPTAASTVAVLTAQRWSRMRAARRRVRNRADSYPDALQMIVLAIRAGYLPAAAIERSLAHLPVDLRGAFAGVGERVAAGQRFADALVALEVELGPIARPLIDSFAAADRYGLPLGPVLDRLSDDARQQRRRAADSRVRQLTVRLSIPLVLCTLPSFVLLAIVPLLLGAFSSLHSP